MIQFKLPAAFAALLLSGAALAACPYPDQIEKLPDGKTAAKEDMLESQQRVKSYVKNMEDYLKCLDDELAVLGEGASEEHHIIRDKRHNAAVEAMDAIAGTFNLAVREYKARSAAN